MIDCEQLHGTSASRDIELQGKSRKGIQALQGMTQSNERGLREPYSSVFSSFKSSFIPCLNCMGSLPADTVMALLDAKGFKGVHLDMNPLDESGQFSFSCDEVNTFLASIALPADVHVWPGGSPNLLCSLKLRPADTISIHATEPKHLALAQTLGCRIGVVLSSLQDYSHELLSLSAPDQLTVMMTPIGARGCCPARAQLSLLRSIRAQTPPSSPPLLMADGGIQLEHLALYRDSVPDAMVAGSILFGNPASLDFLRKRLSWF